MRFLLRATFILIVGAGLVTADSRTLRWSRLVVTATLDADGRLHVQERQSIVFNGDWNGGERIFRQGLDTMRHLDRLSRIEPSGQAVPLHQDKSLADVDAYGWSSSNTLRWRSRLPSDPPFENREITYLLEYSESNILIPADGDYILDHNFGLPDLAWPIDAFSAELSLDPVWQRLDSGPARIAYANAPRGGNATITLRLRHTGATSPAAVNFGAPAPLRYALVGTLVAGLAFFGWQFRTRERALGRFEPLPSPATLDRAWLDEHLFKFRPEVVGAAWDDRTGAAEVAAVIARLVQEGKLSSRVEPRSRGKAELALTLLRPRDAFDGYEASLVKALFIDGDTTSTDKIKAHYKSAGFDPVAKIREPLQKRVGEMAGQSSAPAVDRTLTVVLIGGGSLLIVVGGFAGTLNVIAALVALSIVLALYLAGFFGAIDYRRRLSNLGILTVEFVPASLLIAAVSASMLLGVTGLRFSPYLLAGLALVSLGAIRSLFNLAKSRDAGDRLARRRQLASARDYFARELRSPHPALDDAWFPYVLAFGLGPDADRWFHSFGGTSDRSSTSGATFGSSSGSGPASSLPGGSGWTGAAGGASGGAGASGAWAVAVTELAGGVASPSSSGSGGGGGGGGGSSGGGGGGGW